MKNNIAKIAALLTNGEDFVSKLAYELVEYINLYILTLSPLEIGEQMGEELVNMKFMTGDNGKTASTLIAESLAWNHFGNAKSTFDKKATLELLKGLGFIAAVCQDAASESSQRSRTVRLAFAKFDPATPKPEPKGKGKGKGKGTGSRPAINADMIVSWIEEGNLTDKKEGARIAKAIAKCFNS